jgi:hypothetical protein
MLYAKIEIESTLYVLLHAEQVYRDFRLCEKDSGYFNHEVEENTIHNIYEYIENYTAHIKEIIFDCTEITEGANIADDIDRIINFCQENHKELAFCRMCEPLYRDSRIHGKKNLKEDTHDTITNVYTDGCTKHTISDEDLYQLFQQKIEKILTINTDNKYVKERMGKERYSHSSNVKLPKYINLKAFIEYQKEILFLGLYLLCKKTISEGLIKELIDTGRKPLLFFSSMAGSYLASVFSKLACIDMVFLNHLGPKKKLYRERHKEQLLNDRDYFIISDVVCLGAEIERAKTLIEHAGGNLKGILSVVFIQVVDEKPSIENGIKEVALLTLTKKYNPIKYQIITDFPEIKE